MTDYKPRWGGAVKPHAHNDTYQQAKDKLADSDKRQIDVSVGALTTIRNLGDTGALEALAKLGLFLNGQTQEFTRLIILDGRKAERS